MCMSNVYVLQRRGYGSLDFKPGGLGDPISAVI